MLMTVAREGWTRRSAGVVAAATLATLTLVVPAGGAGADTSTDDTGVVSMKRDVTYRTVDGAAQKLDVYFPTKKGKNRPAVVLIHGGGWRGGDKKAFAEQGTQLAQHDFVAFSINYRLAPQHQYPAAVEDVEAAVEWVRKHAKDYGVDAKRIGALGGSAGGHLTAMLATDGEGSLDTGHRIAVGVSWSGPTDFTGTTIPGSTRNGGGPVETFLGCAPDACPDKYAAASPITHVDKTDAPMLVVNSTTEIIPQAQADTFKAALDQAGVASQEIILPGTAHARAYAKQVWDQSLAFLEQYLKK
jgi:acetyl esterase/lipase